jgi:hypothetical protein
MAGLGKTESAEEYSAQAERSFVIVDVQEVMLRLKRYGVALISKEPTEIRKEIAAIPARNPEGNLQEVVEYAGLASYWPDFFIGGRFLGHGNQALESTNQQRPFEESIDY